MSSILVFGPQGEPLNPCHPARARQLLKKRRARIVSLRPYTIRLVDRKAPNSGSGPDSAPTPVPEGRDEA